MDPCPWSCARRRREEGKCLAVGNLEGCALVPHLWHIAEIPDTLSMLHHFICTFPPVYRLCWTQQETPDSTSGASTEPHLLNARSSFPLLWNTGSSCLAPSAVLGLTWMTLPKGRLRGSPSLLGGFSADGKTLVCVMAGQKILFSSYRFF